MASNKYTDIILEIKGQIGIIKVATNLRHFWCIVLITLYQFNRPKALNSFGGSLMVDIIGALRELNEHTETVFTVVTGEGRFFSAGADVKGSRSHLCS